MDDIADSPLPGNAEARPEDKEPPAAEPPMRWWQGKAGIPLVLLALGFLLLGIAYVLYPPPETGIASPDYPVVTIYTNEDITQVQYLVTQTSSDTAVLQVSVEQSSIFVGGANAKKVSPIVQVTLPLGLTFQNCGAHLYDCNNDPTGRGSSWHQPLTFRPVWATVDFPVNSSGFGVTSNDVSAFAAIPEVDYQYQYGLAPSPIMTADYQIPAASSYDWSSFPPATVSSTSARWDEFLMTASPGTDAVTAGRIASGVDHSRESFDQDLTFAAGALVGIGGGAIVAAIPEAMRRRGD